MELIILIVTIILIGSVITAAVRIIQKGFHVLVILPILFSGLLFAGGLYLNDEIQTFQAAYPDATKILVLEHDGQIIAGFSGTLKTDENITYLSRQELDDATAQFQQHNYRAMRGSNYKLFIFSVAAFDQLSGTIYFHGQDHNTSMIRTILTSSDTSGAYASYTVDQKIKAGKLGDRYRDAASVQLVDEIRKGFGDDAFMRGAIFSSLFSAAILEEGQPFVLRCMKEETAIMEPEETLFRLLRYVPLALLKDTLAAPSVS